ncbi:hypothetical protein EJB05_46147, partial [Eragrostis curvula]
LLLHHTRCAALLPAPPPPAPPPPRPRHPRAAFSPAAPPPARRRLPRAPASRAAPPPAAAAFAGAPGHPPPATPRPPRLPRPPAPSPAPPAALPGGPGHPPPAPELPSPSAPARAPSPSSPAPGVAIQRRGWETIVPGDHKRLPAGILGLLCKAHFPGMVPLRDGGEEPALTWAHYKRVPDVPDEDERDFRTVADRVVGELWDFFRVEPEYRDRAVRWAYDACPKLVTDMHHEARVQAVRSYYAKFLGMKIDKKQARTIWPSEEEYGKVIPWWCATHKPCWDYFVARWCNPEWQKQHEACRERRLKMPGPAHHQGNRSLDDYAASWSQAHDGRECPPLMAWALAHKGKASSSTVDYNPEDGPEAYSNPTVHTHLRRYTEMAREKHGPEWNPSTEDLDGEIIMRLGGGKKHGRYWIGDSTLDTASTPTLSEIRARSSSSTPPIRPRPSAAQLQFEQSQTQLREEMEAKLQEQEKRHRAEMQRQQEEMQREMQERDARMQAEMQHQMQLMLQQWHNNGMLPPPLPLPPIGTPSPTQGTPNISAGSNNQPVSPPAAWSPFPPYPRPPPM